MKTPAFNGPRRPPARQAGMTLIELMVGIAISMLLSVAVFSVLSVSEARKRTTTSANDINQAGNYAIYTIDALVRGAGSGLGQAAESVFGCRLLAANSSGQVLPRNAALPAPFDGVRTGAGNEFRLAPLLIAGGQSTPAISGRPSDVLIVMSSGADAPSVPTPFADVGSNASLTLSNTVNFTAGDLLLLSDQQTASGPADCLVEQVAPGVTGGTAQTLTLGGRYHTAGVNGTGPASYSDRGQAVPLGNPSNGSTPYFQALGVGDHNTLYSYDLLETNSTPLVPIIDGVFELHAVYGVDTNSDGKVDNWVTATGTYSMSALTDGSSAAGGRLRQIKAVRIGIIMRTSLPEKSVVTANRLRLFSDLPGLEYVRDWVSEGEQHYRYRTFEATVPLRNNLLLD